MLVCGVINFLLFIFRKYLAKHGRTESPESTGHYSKHELDCTEAENQPNSLLERNSQSTSSQEESLNQSNVDVDGENGDYYDEEEESSQTELLLLNDPDSRRELMLRAVERRLQQH